jgi:hypothetical protein
LMTSNTPGAVLMRGIALSSFLSSRPLAGAGFFYAVFVSSLAPR